MKPIAERIAEELNVRPAQIAAAIGLLDEGSTVPFIARYRKEATGALDDTELRALETRLAYLRELEDRRKTILGSIREQGKLDAALTAQILAADTKARLEDIYLPFKPKRRTKAQIARENGLEPLAEALISHPEREPLNEAKSFVKPDAVKTAEAALDGARAILTERFAEDAELIGRLREDFWTGGRIVSKVREGKEAAGAKFSDYFDFFEPLMKIPSHRALALMRGEREEILDLKLVPDPKADPANKALGPFELAVARRFAIADRGRPGDRWLLDTARWAWRTKIESGLAVDLRLRIWTQAEDEAVKVFAANLRDLLLAAPAGGRPTIGLDPGFRTGVKVAVVDATGKIVETTAIYPHEPQRRWDESLAVLKALAIRHQAELVAIGNGTASRETDRLVADLLSRNLELKLTKVTVSEAGASVYSASAYAAEELPGLDVTLRGAASIARRLQDPLAELVKIDPKSIGVGQYQHDLSEQKLGRSLDAVVEDCVNAVGVDVNTASAKLLARVSGVGEALAEGIVLHRETHGRFRTRAALKDVPRLGAKAFELSAGFLRINGGEQPLDRSGVHPETYPVVRRILQKLGADIHAVIGNAKALSGLRPADFADERFGVPTVADIFRELEKPGRDPRPAFRTAAFKEGVETIGDLKPGMVLEGTVTNVAAFGAFVDIGVHQDGLVHVSAMANTFVKDPHAIAKPGDVVKVKVLSVDVPRKRIALTMRLSDPEGEVFRGGRSDVKAVRAANAEANRPSSSSGALAEALRRAAEKGTR
jgi:protein Tex